MKRYDLIAGQMVEKTLDDYVRYDEGVMRQQAPVGDSVDTPEFRAYLLAWEKAQHGSHGDREYAHTKLVYFLNAWKDAQLARERHAMNEWADAACNGLQWLRNIEDGTTTDLKRARENMEQSVAHARQVSDAAHAVQTRGEPVTVPAPQPVDGYKTDFNKGYSLGFNDCRDKVLVSMEMQNCADSCTTLDTCRRYGCADHSALPSVSNIASTSQAQGEPVAWEAFVDDWMGRNDVVLKHSAYKELLNGPAPQADEVRDTALEEAAKAVDQLYTGLGEPPDDPHPDAILVNMTVNDCAKVIRALKRSR